jgi:hypothetical protein
MAWLTGEVEQEEKEALIVGNYLHSWNEGAEAHADYKAKYADFIFNKKGEPYAAYKKADEMIACLQADPKAMFYLEGQKEVIQTVEMFGTPWKFKIDVLNPERNYLLELKTTASIREAVWVSGEDGKRRPTNFVEGWGYLLQAALYAEGERLFRKGDEWRDFLCIAVSKESPPDHELIRLRDDERFRQELAAVSERLPRILEVKKGAETPVRCGTCKYCRASKKITVPVMWSQLMPA